MYCTVVLYCLHRNPFEVIKQFKGGDKPRFSKEGNEYRLATFGNFKILANGGMIRITGSLHKFWKKGKNDDRFTFAEAIAALQFISQCFEIPLADWKVKRLDVGLSFQVPFLVESLFKNISGHKELTRKPDNYQNSMLFLSGKVAQNGEKQKMGKGKKGLYFYCKSDEIKNSRANAPPEIIRIETRWYSVASKVLDWKPVTGETLINPLFFQDLIQEISRLIEDIILKPDPNQPLPPTLTLNEYKDWLIATFVPFDFAINGITKRKDLAAPKKSQLKAGIKKTYIANQSPADPAAPNLKELLLEELKTYENDV